MPRDLPLPDTITDRGLRVAPIFALAGERLNQFLEHGRWLTDAQGATLAADWLRRGRRTLERAEREHLSALSDRLARQVADSVSREAALYIAHEMAEALDPNYVSDIARSLMAECERLLDADAAAGA